jgi:hypothetical protein
MWVVEGGIYTDFNFSILEPGTEERYGPFTDYDEAYAVWQGRARFMVDTACHRLVIQPSDENAKPRDG